MRYGDYLCISPSALASCIPLAFDFFSLVTFVQVVRIGSSKQGYLSGARVHGRRTASVKAADISQVLIRIQFCRKSDAMFGFVFSCFSAFNRAR
jgi:hypothetical protein